METNKYNVWVPMSTGLWLEVSAENEIKAEEVAVEMAGKAIEDARLTIKAMWDKEEGNATLDNAHAMMVDMEILDNAAVDKEDNYDMR